MRPVDWRRTRIGKYLRHIPRPKHLRGSWLHKKLGDNLLHSDLWRPERRNVAAGFALGAFFSMIPMPFQMVPTLLLGYFTRVNLAAALVGVWISNPITTPFIFYFQYKIGVALLGLEGTEPGVLEAGHWLAFLKAAPLAILFGGMLTGVLLSAISYPLALWVWDRITSAVRRSRLRREASRREAKSTAPFDS